MSSKEATTTRCAVGLGPSNDLDALLGISGTMPQAEAPFAQTLRAHTSQEGYVFRARHQRHDVAKIHTGECATLVRARQSGYNDILASVRHLLTKFDQIGKQKDTLE